MQSYDVVYRSDRVTIEPHFCREWDESGGCYGTNPDHGMSLEDACNEVADHYQRLADEWRNRTHPDVKYYMDAPNGDALKGEDQ